jgi:hypothetical protein
MRIGSRRGVTFACTLTLGLLAAVAAPARADWFHHTIEKEVPAMDHRTGTVMMAPPIPYGEYTKDYVGCIHGALGAAKGAAHGLLGKLCSLCGNPGCGQCGGLGHHAGGGACGGCGGDGCSNCNGGGRLTTCGMLHGGGAGGAGGMGHGHAHGVPMAAGNGYVAPMAAAGGKGFLGGLFGGGHKHRAGAAGGCATCGTGGVFPTAQGVAPSTQMVAQPTAQGPMSACGACGGRGRLGNGICGPCGGKGLLAGLGHGGGGGLKGCTACGGQGRLGNGACGPCGGKGLLAGNGNGGCDSPCGACGGKGRGGNGGACGACGGSGCLKGALNHVAGTAHGLVGKLFHKGEIEYFVGPGGPVPITPGYVPYVVPVRSPRDFFAFPPMNERADPYSGGYGAAERTASYNTVQPQVVAPVAVPRRDVTVTPPTPAPPAPGVTEDAGAIEMNP